MKYERNFKFKSLKKGARLRLLNDDNKYDYFTIGTYDPKFGWELKPEGHPGLRFTGNLIFVRDSDFPGDYELEVE